MAEDGMGVIRGERDAAMAMADATPGKTRVNEGEEEEIGAHWSTSYSRYAAIWAITSEGYF